jgi:hypothetical protein
MGFVLQMVNTQNIMKMNHAMQKTEVNFSEDIYNNGVQSFSNYAVAMNLGGINLIKNSSY